MINYKVEVYSNKNSIAIDKTNEDHAFFDDNSCIGMVLDGVTRDRENDIYPDPSPARVATRIFAHAALSEAEEEDAIGINKIKKMIQKGSEEVRSYNAKLKHRFPAGLVGVVFMIEEDVFYYGYIGDCYAAIIRQGFKRPFTECQTEMIKKHKKEYTSDEIRFEICNHINHPYGYGVWDGNERAMDFVKYGAISLADEDVILICTDGMRDELKNQDLHKLLSDPLEWLDNGGENKDDRTCIRLSFNNDFTRQIVYNREKK